MRWMKLLLAAAVGVVLAAGVLIWEGNMLERIFSVGEVPVIDFATLQRTTKPNQYLLCPNDLCRAYIDDLPPLYGATVPELRSAWEALVQAEPRVTELRRDAEGTQIDYVQRSRLLRFPDLITVRFIPIGERRSTLAVYSRSIYGEGDMGVNKARIRDWIAKLNKVLKLG